MRDVVCGLVADGAGRVLLGLRAPQKRAYANHWDVFGGHVEAGESLDEALVRELREELGIRATQFVKLGSAHEANPGANGLRHYHFYGVSAWSGEPENACDEHVTIGWFTRAEALELHPLVPSTRSAIAAHCR